MTGLETMIDSVLEEARRTARQILDAANAEAEARIVRAQAEAEETRGRAEAEADAAAKRILDRGVSASQRKIKQILLERKQELISAAVEAAYQQLLHMPEETYEAFVLKRLEKLPEEAEGILRFVPRDGELVSKTLKKELKKRHPRLVISEEPLRADGGFILTVGQIEENGTYRALLDDSLDRIRDEAGRLLFEEAVE